MDLDRSIMVRFVVSDKLCTELLMCGGERGKNISRFENAMWREESLLRGN